MQFSTSQTTTPSHAVLTATFSANTARHAWTGRAGPARRRVAVGIGTKMRSASGHCQQHARPLWPGLIHDL